MAAMSLVSARVEAAGRDAVLSAFRRATSSSRPPGLRQTFLLTADDGTVAIATVWESREALDAVRSSGEEPLARRLLREAGGTPQVQFFDVAAEG